MLSVAAVGISIVTLVANAQARREDDERYTKLEKLTSQLIELESSREKMHEDERHKIFERIIPKLRQSVVTEMMNGTDAGLVDKLGDGASPQWIMDLRDPDGGWPKPQLCVCDPHGCKCF